MTEAKLDARLWAFLLAVYAKPGVSAACLQLQDTCKADIVLLLIWAYHLRPDQSPLTAKAVAGLQAHVAPWRARAILPLRALRIDLRDGTGLPDPEREELRQQIKTLELRAERSQVALVARWLAHHSILVGAIAGPQMILGETYPSAPLEVIQKAALSL